MKRIAAVSFLASVVSLISFLASPASAVDRPARVAADDGTWVELAPPARYVHSAIYDPNGDRMIVFGGSLYGGLRSLALGETPFWSQLPAAGTPPAVRYDHTAIYDPVRLRMIVFGGQAGALLTNDVWALSLTGAPTWTQLSTVGTPPTARKTHTAIYDPVRDRMIVYGGIGTSDVELGDVWALSLSGTPTWSSITPAGTPPAPRDNHTAIYDPSGDRMVVLDGEDSEAGATLDEIWSLSLGGSPAWSPITASGGPGPLCRHAAVYDPVRAQMLVATGLGNPGNTAWALSLTGAPTWTELATSGGPLPDVWDQTLVYDSARDRAIHYGGEDPPFTTLVDAWALDLPTLVWSQIGPVTPKRRHNHTAIVDAARQRVIVFGGRNGYYEDLGDVWSLSLVSPNFWTPLAPSGPAPPARENHSAVVDVSRERMIVFGGSGMNDVWALSLSGGETWIHITPAGGPPSGRSGHTAIYDEARDRMIVFGGNDGSDRNDVWELTLSGTPTWTLLTPAGSPPPARTEHTAIYDPVRDRMIVYGGFSGTTPRSDVWALSLSGPPAWAPLSPVGGNPYARGKHTAVYDQGRDRMIVFSGSRNSPNYSADVWELSLGATPSWTMLAPAGLAAVGRQDHSAVYDAVNERLVVFGGVRVLGLDYLLEFLDTTALQWNALVSVPSGDHGRLELAARLEPNPASGVLRIEWSLPRAGTLTVRVHDITGRLVRTLAHGDFAAGPRTMPWDRRDQRGQAVPAGVYLVTIESGPSRVVRRAVLLD